MVVGLWMDSVGEYPVNSNQTMNTINRSLGVRLWGINCIVKREIAQTIG